MDSGGKSDQWKRSASTRTTMLVPVSENTRAGSSPTDQSSCGTPRIALKRKSSSPRGSHWRSTPYVVGWWRDGHRWRLGAGPCVVQDGGSGHHDLQADQQLLLGSGVRGLRRWTGQISGNRRYRRRHGVLVSICVACILAAPPLTKNGACSKPAKAFAKIPARSGERSLLVNSMHARIHIVERRNGHRDDRGTLGVCNASMLGAAKPGDSGRS